MAHVIMISEVSEAKPLNLTLPGTDNMMNAPLLISKFSMQKKKYFVCTFLYHSFVTANDSMGI